MSHERVVAVYDTVAHADAAVNTLKSAGYSADDIQVFRNEDDAAKAGSSEQEFWHHLFRGEIKLQSEGGRSGPVVAEGVVVSVRVPNSESLKVIRLLDTYKPVDVLGPPRTYRPPVAEPVRVAVPPPTFAPRRG